MQRIACLRFLILLLTCDRLTCLPVREARDTDSYTPSKDEAMMHGLYTMYKFLATTFPKSIDIPLLYQAANRQRLLPVFKSYQELINLQTTISHLNVNEGSGNQESSQELIVAQSLLSKIFKDACEWIKETLEVDEAFDCSNDNDIHEIIIHNAILTAVDDTKQEVKELREGLKKTNILKYCQWFFCNTNPECGKATSSSNYIFMKDKIGCSNLDKMHCNVCTSE